MTSNFLISALWVFGITVFSVLVSGGVTFILFEIDPEVVRSDVQIVSIILPIFIAPICTILVLRERLKAQRLAEENRWLANTDALTELPNRRAFFGTATKGLSTGQNILAYIICDIDEFKNFNDRYGHHTGDQVLVHVARTIRNAISDDGIVARLGGEEFGIKLLVGSETEALQIAERIVKSVELASLVVGGRSHKVTISAGISLAKEDLEQSKAMSSADKAMYEAKSQGKNRVVLAA